MYQRLLDDNNQEDAFSEFKLSDCENHSLKLSNNTIINFEIVVFDNDSLELSSLPYQYGTQRNDDQSVDLPQGMFKQDEHFWFIFVESL